MNSNNFTIKDLEAVLTPEDKAYCDKLFRQYEDLQNIAMKIFVDGDRRLLEYNKANKEGGHLFKRESDILASHMRNIDSSMDETSRSLITLMESYFEMKYSLEEFPSLLKSDGYQVSGLMANYNAVIANMINETGKDFSKGKP